MEGMYMCLALPGTLYRTEMEKPWKPSGEYDVRSLGRWQTPPPPRVLFCVRLNHSSSSRRIKPAPADLRYHAFVFNVTGKDGQKNANLATIEALYPGCVIRLKKSGNTKTFYDLDQLESSYAGERTLWQLTVCSANAQLSLLPIDATLAVQLCEEVHAANPNLLGLMMILGKAAVASLMCDEIEQAYENVLLMNDRGALA